MKKLTVRDIARKSGLSIATVSRILSGKGGHRFATVKHLERCMFELGMRVNLSCPGADCVGIVTHTAYDCAKSPYASALLSRLQRELALNGFLALMISVIPSRLTPAYLERIIENHRLAGLVVLDHLHMEKLIEPLNTLAIPCVWLGNGRDDRMKWRISCNNHDIGVAAAGLMLTQSRSMRAGIISVASPDECHLLRQNGFSQSWCGCDKHKISWRYEAAFDADEGVRMVRELEGLPLSRRPGVIFSTDSSRTLELLHALKASVLQVPQDLRIVSVEDDHELAEYAGSITILRQPCREMGQLGAQLLLDIIHGRLLEPRHEVLGCGN